MSERETITARLSARPDREAITAAHRLGFEICGFDTTRHRGTPQQGEVAVYLAHAIDGDARA